MIKQGISAGYTPWGKIILLENFGRITSSQENIWDT